MFTPKEVKPEKRKYQQLITEVTATISETEKSGIWTPIHYKEKKEKKTATLAILSLHPHWQSRGLYPLTSVTVEEVL